MIETSVSQTFVCVISNHDNENLMNNYILLCIPPKSISLLKNIFSVILVQKVWESLIYTDYRYYWLIH